MKSTDVYVFVLSLAAAVLAVRGTGRQKRLTLQRILRERGASVDNYDAVNALYREIPVWRVRRRRERKSEIEELLKEDPVALRDYHELHLELSAWNDLETVAALAISIAVWQIGTGLLKLLSK